MPALLTTFFRYVAPGEVFGQQSQPAPEPAWTPDPATGWEMLSDNLTVKLFAMAIFALYCYMACYYRGSFASLVKSLGSKLYEEKLIEEQNYTFVFFLRLVGAMGLMSCSMLIIRCLTLFAKPNEGEIWPGVPDWGALLLPVAIVTMLFLMLLYQHLLLYMVGGIIRSPLFVKHLHSLRRILGATGVLFIAPFILLFALVPESAAKKISFLVFILFLLFYLLFVGKTYRYFNGQKVSIFYWILYLCAVEIFPVSVFVVLTLRNL